MLHDGLPQCLIDRVIAARVTSGGKTGQQMKLTGIVHEAPVMLFLSDSCLEIVYKHFPCHCLQTPVADR
ncbi:hypothetical protein GCM10010082_17220 [Kushneria pakistanensis]|uniref:Uncharacterized protein n=1 Tax=Kushneria pakistanensis TaxID=1508770 RepID=A0ABQ3FIN3_9GAMM|nr:hypothetical protein GCM10010082_17220 [Kushneria pakistanensis]